MPGMQRLLVYNFLNQIQLLLYTYTHVHDVILRTSTFWVSIYRVSIILAKLFIVSKGQH